MHLFVINPRSFKDGNQVNALKEGISRLCGQSYEHAFHVSRYPRDAVGIVNRFASRHASGIRVYAIGGDGILFDCLNGVVGYPEAELATVPYGRTNDFARAMSDGDMSYYRNIERLLKAPSLQADIINCGGNYCLNFCSVGVESAALLKWSKMQARLFHTKRKWLINRLLTLSGVISLFDKTMINQYYSITVDGQNFDGQYAVANFSNGPCCGGDKSIVPEAVFNDGLVDVLLVKNVSQLKLLSILPDYLAGRYDKHPEYIRHILAREITIQSEKPLFVNLDGECFLDNRITLKIMPSAVKIIGAKGPAFRGSA